MPTVLILCISGKLEYINVILWVFLYTKILDMCEVSLLSDL